MAKRSFVPFTLPLALVLALSPLHLGAAARADEPPKRAFLELTSLRLLREHGIISQAELDSALRDLADTLGAQAGDSLTLVLGRWSTTLYGFVEADHIFDTTQSFNDLAGSGQVARPDSYAGTHPRLTFSVRNSRIGFRLRAPEYHRVRVSALLEMDFMGNQPPGATEAAFFANPGFRIRHFNLKIETPIADLLIGQSWQLFGWQSAFHPNSVQIQGVPGQIYGRTPQIRLSKTLKTRAVTVEVAAAVMRPPQRDSATPEGQAGVRLAVDRVRAMQTTGATGTSTAPLSVAVTADVRHFSLAEFSATPKDSVGKTGWGIAADAFVPLLPARAGKKGNTLALNGELAYGYGIADLYTGLSGGVVFPALPNPTGATPAPTYTPNVDPGLVVFATDGTAHLIQWQSYLVGAQYYFPRLDGRLWLSTNYSHLSSNNARLHGPENKTRTAEDFVDASLFGDPTPSVRLGLEYAYYRDQYSDGVTATQHRVQLAVFYLF